MSSKNQAIKMLAEYHPEYIKMVKALAGNNMNVRNYAEDYVQEAYLKLLRYDNLFDKVITEKGKVQKGYMFFALRSIVFNDLKKKSNLKYNHLGDQYDFEEKFMHIDNGRETEDVAAEALEAKLYEVLKENVQWFDYELFKTYMTKGESFRTLAKESGIGVRTIYLSIKRSKTVIAEKLYEDYQDFINGDYDRIL